MENICSILAVITILFPVSDIYTRYEYLPLDRRIVLLHRRRRQLSLLGFELTNLSQLDDIVYI